jgi:cytochrome P450
MAEPQIALVDAPIDDAQQPEEAPPPPIPTGLELTTLDANFRGSPYDVLADMRERAPVHRDDELRRFYVSRHADVEALLRDDELFTDPRKSNKKTLSRKRSDSESRRTLPLELMDGPEHARLRRFVGTVFSDAAIAAFAPRIDAIIRTILDELEESEFEFEVMGLYADRVAGTAMLEMLGIESTDYRVWRRRCDASRAAAFNPFRTKDEASAGSAANVELDSALRAEVDKRRAKPGSDLISAMLKLDVDGDAPTHSEIIHIARMLLIGGVSNTADLIGNGLRAMLQNTRQMTQLREHPDLAAAAVEEVLRFDTPIADTIRIANRDMTVGECPIKRGETMTVSIAGANRDEALFAQPGKFDIVRNDIRHLSFGEGRHACLGATFARVVAAKAIVGLVVQFPQSELSPRGWAFAAVPGLRVMTHFWIKT